MLTETFVNLTNDITFKFVFSHESLITDLLLSFFDYIGIHKKIESIRVFKDYSIYGANLEDKVFFGDIVAILDTEEIVSIEMYTNFGKEEYMKSASYLSRLFGNQLKKSDTYLKAKKVYSINFMSGNYYKENTEVINDYGFVRKIEKPSMANEFISMYLIRLDLVKNMVYNKNKKRLIRWLRLMNAKSIDEMKKIGGNDKTMEQTIAYVDAFLKEEGTTFQDKINYEKNKSHEEGFNEGIKENAIEIARNLLKTELKIDDIAKATGLSKQEIEALK